MKKPAPGGPRQFAAFIERDTIFLLEYQRYRDRLDILTQNEESGEFLNATDAGEALTRLLRERHGSGGRIVLTIRGLGSCHHILVLPHAKPEVLRPVVQREMNRLYPDLQHPIVEFVAGEQIDRRARPRPEAGSPPQELLAAAIPRSSVEDLESALSRASVSLEHVTVLPQVLQRLYREVASTETPTAVLMLLRGGALFGFFHERQLRLVFEPPGEESGPTRIDAQFVIEQLERGNLYLRQQFRGTQIARLLIAGDPAIIEKLTPPIEGQMGLDVQRFAAEIGSANAVAAMGAVLDSEDAQGLNLFPIAETRKKTAEQLTRRIAIAAGVLLAAICWWWAANGVVATLGWRSRIETLQQALERRVAPMQPIRDVVKRRQLAAQQLNVVRLVADERARLQQLIQAIAIAPGAGINVEEFDGVRDQTNWRASLGGGAESGSAADVVSLVHQYYRALPRIVGASDVSLDNLKWIDSTGVTGVVAVHFGLHFSAPTGAVDTNVAASSTPASPAPPAK
jgi:hypothetical protein